MAPVVTRSVCSPFALPASTRGAVAVAIPVEKAADWAGEAVDKRNSPGQEVVAGIAGGWGGQAEG